MKSNLEIDALKALVGAASISQADALVHLDESRATSSDCESPQVRALWAAIEARLRAGQPLDAVALRVQLPDVDRALVLAVLTERPLGMAPERLRLVHEAALRRQYLQALRALAGLVKDSSQSLDSLVAEGQRLLGAWANDTTNQAAPLDESVFPVLETLEAVQLGRKATTVPTGWAGWDEILGGLQPTLTIVGALPGVGKSALVSGICRTLAQRGITTGLLSLEDEREWLTRRLLALESDVPLFVLANRPLTTRQMERVGVGAPKAHALLGRILCDDRSGLTPAEVVASARNMIARGAKAVLVDHLGEMRLARTDRHDLDIADALAELRRVAKTTRTPVLVLSHLRRRDGLDLDKEPRLTDFAFSAGVERMARVALGLWRGGNGELNCTVLKQTQGASGLTLSLQFHEGSAVVTDCASTQGTRNLYNGGDT